MKPLFCKECKYFYLSNTEEGASLCKFKDYWEITTPDTSCRFLPIEKHLTCQDCYAFTHDTACMGCLPTDSVYFNDTLCPGFIDKKEAEFFSILAYWKSRGLYDRSKVISLIDEYEKDIYELEKQV